MRQSNSRSPKSSDTAPAHDLAVVLDQLLSARVTVFIVDRRRFDARRRMSPTVVPTARLLLIEQGTAQYHLDGYEFPVMAGQMLLVPTLAKRWWQSTGRRAFGMGWVEFLVGNSAPVDLPATIAKLTPDQFATELSALKRILTASQRNDRISRLLIEAEVRSMLARLFSHPELKPISLPAESDRHREPIQAALAWLERHYAERSPERALARRVGLSENHFRLRFRESVGMNPRAFVLELRLHAARQLLASGTMSVKEVAFAVGYPDALLFSRLYRRRWGLPPSQDQVAPPCR